MGAGHLENVELVFRPTAVATVDGFVLVAGALPSGAVATALLRPPGELVGSVDIDERGESMGSSATWQVGPNHFLSGVAGCTPGATGVDASTRAMTSRERVTPEGWWAVLLRSVSLEDFAEVRLLGDFRGS